MGYADRLTGSDLVVEFLPVGGTPGTDEIVMTGDQTAFNFSRKLDTVDVTAGNEKERAFKPTIESLDWSLSIYDADQSYLADILPRAEGKLSIYKIGNAATKPVVSFNTLLTGYDEDFPFDGALEIQLSGVRQGAMVEEIGSVVAGP